MYVHYVQRHSGPESLSVNICNMIRNARGFS